MEAAAILWAQTSALARSNIKARYRGTWAGVVWVVLQPAAIFGLQALVFGTVFRSRIPHYPVYLLSGLLPWFFFQQSIEMGTPVFASLGRLIRYLDVCPVVYLAAQVLDCFGAWALVSLALLVPVMAATGAPLGGLVLLPLASLPLAAAATGVALALTTLQVFLRDTRFMASFALQLAYMATPIFYDPAALPERLRPWVAFNPLHHLILPFRLCAQGWDPSGFLRAWAVAAAIGAVSLAAGIAFWRARRRELAFHV